MPPLEKLSLLIPLGYDNHIIRIAPPGSAPPGDNLYFSNVSLEALAVGPSSDVDQFAVVFANGLPGDNLQRIVVGVGAPLVGLIIGEDESKSHDAISFEQTRLDVGNPVSTGFFFGTGAKKPELHVHCFFQKPPFIPVTRSRDFYQGVALVQLAETQCFRRPFYGRSRLSFFAKTAPGGIDTVELTLRGYKFTTSPPFTAVSTDLLTGFIPPGGMLSFDMQNRFFDAIECVALTTNIAGQQFFVSVEIADGPTG